MQQYVDILCKEIAISAKFFPGTEPLKTVFFGGGTPSLLPQSLLSQILETLRNCYGIENSAEISTEMDPGTFDAKKLDAFLDHGVNRVSLGVQAFQEHLLTKCGRSHSVDEIYESIAMLHSAGVSNWSMDLISSLPGQTPDLWQQSLLAAIAANPSHVSIYDLQIEDGTAFGRWYKPGQHPLPSNNTSATMYEIASESLRAAGYSHYEISNYAKPGSQCRHNLVYWGNQSYHGFGLGAASYVGKKRYSRPKTMADYSLWVEQYERNSGIIVDCVENGEEDDLLDTVMLSLRLCEQGLDLMDVRSKFGEDVCRKVLVSMVPYVKSGHVEMLGRDGSFLGLGEGLGVEEILTGVRVVRLTDPKGLLMSNDIISTLFSSLD